MRVPGFVFPDYPKGFLWGEKPEESNSIEVGGRDEKNMRVHGSICFCVICIPLSQ
jgi:hypothetical protein